MVDTAGFDQAQTIEHLKTTQQAVREMRRSMVWFMLGMKTRNLQLPSKLYELIFKYVRKEDPPACTSPSNLPSCTSSNVSTTRSNVHACWLTHAHD